MNTEQWLDKITSSKEELEHWLKRQYIGEFAAAQRVAEFAKTTNDSTKREMLLSVARDEARHASWVKNLLINRNIDIPEIEKVEDRYWKPVLGKNMSFDELAAAGHLAEGMRLIRIRALANSEKIDTDIRQVFGNILADEENHEKVFLDCISNKSVLQSASVNHELGLKELGLEI